VIANSHYTHRTVDALFPGAWSEVFHSPTLHCEIANRGENRQAIRSRFETPQSAVVLLMVARFEAWKGHTFLLDALVRLKDLPWWHCWITGEAQRPQEAKYLQLLQTRVREEGLGHRVRFVGYCERLPEVYAAADIYCQPNTGPESLGITFAEALDCGLPVITTGLGGALEIVDDSCGILVPPGDVSALVGAIRSLIEDGERRARMAAAAPARARELFDLESQMHALAGLVAAAAGPRAVKSERSVP
jgi:glycosyltransferase involved in cell wall biosynthesis